MYCGSNTFLNTVEKYYLGEVYADVGIFNIFLVFLKLRVLLKNL